MNKTLSLRRKEKDIFKLRSANYQVIETEQQSTYHVEFLGTHSLMKGPKELHMKKASGPSICIYLRNIHIRVLLLASSIKFSIPTSIMGNNCVNQGQGQFVLML